MIQARGMVEVLSWMPCRWWNCYANKVYKESGEHNWSRSSDQIFGNRTPGCVDLWGKVSETRQKGYRPSQAACGWEASFQNAQEDPANRCSVINSQLCQQGIKHLHRQGEIQEVPAYCGAPLCGSRYLTQDWSLLIWFKAAPEDHMTQSSPASLLIKSN